VYMMIMRM